MDSLDSISDHLGVTRKLLAESKWSSILGVGSSDLNDILELLLLLLKSLEESLETGEQDLVSLDDCGDMHGSWESIVGTLTHVDVVVRVHELAPVGTSENFDGLVSDNLVHVHVRLGSGSGLPDDEWELLLQISGDDLISGLHDGVSHSLVELVSHVNLGAALLQDSESLDDWVRHSISFLGDLEVLERSLSLGTPVSVSGHLDLSEGIVLDSVF